MRSALAILLLCLVGCAKSGDDQALMSHLSSREQKIVGTYTLEKNHENSADPELKKFDDFMSSLQGPITLQCKADKTFQMNLGTTPIAGKWAIEGTNVRLTIETVSQQPSGNLDKVGDTSRGLDGIDFSSPDRDRFLSEFMDRMALDEAKSLSLLRIGVDSKSLYTNASDPGSLAGGGFRTFKKSSGGS